MIRRLWAFLTVIVAVVAFVAGVASATQTPRPFPTPSPRSLPQPPQPAPAGPTTESLARQSVLDVRVGVARADGGHDAVTIPLEIYVARVLGGEAAPNTAPGALEALAIAVRTYAMVNMGRHASGGFDVCDQVHCQVVRTANATTESAAAATAGRILVKSDGSPARVFYSASCGGRTEIPSAVWPGEEDPPYMPSQPDAACEGEPVWSTNMSLADVERTLTGAGFTGQLRDVRIASHGVSGRVATIEVTGMTPRTISAQDLRMAVSRVFGPRYLMSAAFTLQRAGDTFTFSGRGYGHGVGMCVFGAMNLARQGGSAQSILRHYFPGLAIGPVRRGVPSRPPPSTTQARPSPPLPQGAPGVAVAGLPPTPSTATAASTAATPALAGINLIVPATAAPDPALASLVAGEADRVAAWLGVRRPAALNVRIHASPADFMEATNQQWFVPGAVVRGEVHLPPVQDLRARGMLERTIRHAIVHRLADDALATRRAWVREGLAVYAAEPDAVARPPQAPPRVACPADAELLQPLSAGAFAEAAARARHCVVRQLANGRDWRDVR